MVIQPQVVLKDMGKMLICFRSCGLLILKVLMAVSGSITIRRRMMRTEKYSREAEIFLLCGIWKKTNLESGLLHISKSIPETRVDAAVMPHD